MKKKYIVLLVTALLASSVMACKPESQTSTQSPSSIEENDGKNESTIQDVSTEKQLLMDHNGIKVYALPCDPTKTTLSIQAENTSEQNYIIQFANIAVNDFVMHPSFSLNVDAGSTTETNLAFSADALEECGIQTVSRVDAQLVLLDASSFETIYTSGSITITTGEPEIQNYDETGNVIYNKDGLKLVSKGIFDDSVYGKCLKIYISNDTDQDLALESSEIIANDVTLDVIFSITVPKGKKALGSMTIFQEDLDKYLITEIDSLETTLKILDPDTFELRQTIDDIELNFNS